MKNMLCNLVEDMLNNWVEARDFVLTMKTGMVEIDAQLTAINNSFSYKGTASISAHGGRDWGGGGSGSATGGLVLTSRGGGGSGSATGCTTMAPQAPPFPIPLTIEPLLSACVKCPSRFLINNNN